MKVEKTVRIKCECGRDEEVSEALVRSPEYNRKHWHQRCFCGGFYAMHYRPDKYWAELAALAAQ